MTWEELVEKAEKLGYVVCQYGNCLVHKDRDIHVNNNLLFFKDGVINARHSGKSCFVAEHRNPSEMYKIMLALEN